MSSGARAARCGRPDTEDRSFTAGTCRSLAGRCASWGDAGGGVASIRTARPRPSPSRARSSPACSPGGREICRQVGKLGRSVAEVAREFGVSWHTAMAAVRVHGAPMVDDPRRLHGVRALASTSTRCSQPPRTTGASSAPSSWTSNARGSSTSFPTEAPHRSRPGWMPGPRTSGPKSPSRRSTPHAGNARAIRTPLPRATITLDPFHLVKLANGAIDDERMGHPALMA